jgi:protein-disulfide isomerase
MSSLKPLKQSNARLRQRRRTSGKRATDAAATRPPLALFYGIFGLLVLVGAVALVLRARAGSPIAPSDVPVGQAIRPLNAPTGQTPEGYWFKGAADAPVTVVVFADFQCPSCAAAFRQIEGGIDSDYVEPGKVRIVFHDFPLPQHANAIPTALAARAAGDQGKFWSMHDLLYSRQGEWQGDDAGTIVRRLKGYAAELGLDQATFDSALDGKQAEAAIKAAATDAGRQGINATPTYLVDNKPVTAADLRAAIDAALQAKGR